MTDTSNAYIDKVLNAAPFADQQAGIPQMCDLIAALRKRVEAADALEAACDRFTDADFHDANTPEVQSIYRARAAYRATVTP